MNPIPYLQQLLMLALNIVLPRMELDQGERDGRIGEQTGAAIRRFLTENNLTVPTELRDESPEWIQWVIHRLEAATKGRFMIYGQAQDTASRPSPGLTVRALDRDLPSLERRSGAAPQPLGEALTDEEGRFAITYALDRFSAGESNQRAFDRTRGKRADLSFQVFDPNGQELNIAKIMVQDREFGPTDIIFNVSERFEVTLQVEPRTTEALSEYELILTWIGPIIQDVPLADLTDDDIAFIVNEIGLTQVISIFDNLGQSIRTIEWLRRSALLARETDLPIEAFYGWGRKDLPDGLAALVQAPLKELPEILQKLTDLSEERLRQALRDAVAENIIPAALRDRVDEIVRQLKRRDQIVRTVVALLQDEETKAALPGYTVTTFDEDTGGESRGLDITDNEGKFLFDFYTPRDQPASPSPREFRLEVLTPDGEKLPNDGHVSVDLTQPETETVPASVKVPKPKIDKQREVFRTLLQGATPALQTYLGVKLNIHTLADIRRKGGLSQLSDLPKDDPAFIRKLEALADLDRISPDVELTQVLLNKGYDSVLAVADAPYSEFISVVSDQTTELTALETAKLHVMATVQTHLLNNILAGMAADIANGFDLPTAPGESPGENP